MHVRVTSACTLRSSRLQFDSAREAPQAFMAERGAWKLGERLSERKRTLRRLKRFWLKFTITRTASFSFRAIITFLASCSTELEDFDRKKVSYSVRWPIKLPCNLCLARSFLLSFLDSISWRVTPSASSDTALCCIFTCRSGVRTILWWSFNTFF